MDHTRLTIIELCDVEYYCDLEMWVGGHSRSSKVITFESLGTVSYSPSIVVSLACKENIQRIFKRRYSASQNSLTLKSKFGVVQGH